MTEALFGYKRLLCLVSFVVSVLCAIDDDTTPRGSTLTTDFYDGGYCSTSWTRHNNSCYHLMTEKNNFTEASKICSDQGAHMLSITDAAENKFITSLRSSMDPSWIGLYRQTTTSCDYLASCDWVRLDGSHLGYQNWSDEIYPSNSRCAVIESSGAWGNSRRCTTNLEFICEGEVLYPTTMSGYCKTSWKRHNKSCYLLMPEKYNFTEASKSCSDQGAHMLSITDAAENKFITSLRSSVDPSWIGLYRQTTTSCDYLASCDWVWLDESRLGYHNWSTEIYPSNSRCAIIESSGAWGNSRRCTTILEFICEGEVLYPTTTTEVKTMMMTTDIAFPRSIDSSQ